MNSGEFKLSALVTGYEVSGRSYTWVYGTETNPMGQLLSCPQLLELLCDEGNTFLLELPGALQHLIAKGACVLIKNENHNNITEEITTKKTEMQGPVPISCGYELCGRGCAVTVTWTGQHWGFHSQQDGGAHSLPHIGMSLLSAFITMEDIVMVTGMASK